MSTITFDDLLFDRDGKLRIGHGATGKPLDNGEREAFKEFARDALSWLEGDDCIFENATPVNLLQSLGLENFKTWHLLRGSGLIEVAGRNGFTLAPLRDAINATLRPTTIATAPARIAPNPGSKTTAAKPRTALERLAAGAARDLARS